MAAAWLAVHLAIERRFRANPSDVGLHWKHFGLAFHHPHYWPQIMTAFGYLWLPLLFTWRYLKREQIAFIVGALPGILVSAVFGIWQESRVWAEWNAVAACLVFSATAEYLHRQRYMETREESVLFEMPSAMPVPEMRGARRAGDRKLGAIASGLPHPE